LIDIRTLPLSFSILYHRWDSNVRALYLAFG
jgi:hypothetical protein